MNTATYTPNETQRAYAHLTTQVFLFLRNYSGHKAMTSEAIFDLADAMHNVTAMMVGHDELWNDET